MVPAIAALMIAAALSAIPVRGEAAPVDPMHPVAVVIDREDIEMSGLTSVRELLSSRTAFNSFGLYRAGFAASAAILVNGRAISGLDLDTLPISTVERIEIVDRGPVRFGAGALSDAINIVLRNGHEGAAVSAGAGRPTQEGRDSHHGSALWGSTLGRGHLTIGIDHIYRQEVRDSDRDFSRAVLPESGSFSDAQGINFGGNTIIFVPTGESGAAVRSLGDCDTSVYAGVLSHPAGEGCGFAFADTKWQGTSDNGHYVRRSRESLFLNLEQPLNDNDDVYAEARTAQQDTLFRYAPSVGTFDFAPSGAVRDRLAESIKILDGDVFPSEGAVRVAHRFVGHGSRDWPDRPGGIRPHARR